MKIYNAKAFKDIGILYYLNKKGEKAQKRITQGEFAWYFCITKADAAKHQQLLKGLRDEGTISNITKDGDYYRIYCNHVQWSDECDSAVVKGELKSHDVKLYEADLKLHERYIIDNNIQLTEDHKIAHFDIETKDDVPGIVPGRDRIVSIAILDRNGDQFYYSEKSERLLLEKAFKKMAEYTIITSWWGTGFDWPAIKLRADFHQMKFPLHDINHIDLLNWFKKALQAGMLEERPNSFKIGDICQQYLEITKTEGVSAGGGNIWRLFNEDPELLKEYNIQDVVLLKGIDEKLQIVDQCIKQSNITKAYPGGLNQVKQGLATPSQLVDNFLLNMAFKLNKRLSTKNNDAQKETANRWIKVKKPKDPKDKLNDILDDAVDRDRFLKLNGFTKKKDRLQFVDMPTADLFAKILQEKLDKLGKGKAETAIQAVLLKFADEMVYCMEKKEITYPGGMVYCKKQGLYDKVISWDFKGYYNSLMRTFNVGLDTLLMPEDLMEIERDKRPSIPIALSPYTWLNQQILGEFNDKLTEEGFAQKYISEKVEGYNIPVEMPEIKLTMPTDEVKAFYIQTEKWIDEMWKRYDKKMTIQKESFSGFFFKFIKKKIPKSDNWDITIKMPYQCYFRQDFDSIIRICLEIITKERAVWKEKKAAMKDAGVDQNSAEFKSVCSMELSYKLIGNIFYGQIGNIFSRIYHPAIAMSITLAGQLTTQWTNHFFEKAGLVCQYNDTDSNYIFDKEYTPEREAIFIKFFEKNYHKRLWQMCKDRYGLSTDKNCIILEREKRWYRIMFLKKKRYVGYVEESDGKACWELVARGVELRRTGTIKFAREFQEGYYEMIFSPEVPSQETFKEYIKNKRDEFFKLEFNNPVAIEEVTKRMKVNKNIEEYKANTPQVNLMIRCKESGMDIQKGDLVQYVHLDMGEGQTTKYAETADNFLKHHKEMKIDVNAYWDDEILFPIFQQLTDLFPDIQWGDFHKDHVLKRDKKLKAQDNKLTCKKQADQLKAIEVVKTYRRFSRQQRFDLLKLFRLRYDMSDEVVEAKITEIEQFYIDNPSEGVEDLRKCVTKA